jgi:hypothetical protein
MGGARYKGAWLSIQWNSRERRAAEIKLTLGSEKNDCGIFRRFHYIAFIFLFLAFGTKHAISFWFLSVMIDWAKLTLN